MIGYKSTKVKFFGFIKVCTKKPHEPLEIASLYKAAFLIDLWESVSSTLELIFAFSINGSKSTDEDDAHYVARVYRNRYYISIWINRFGRFN